RHAEDVDQEEVCDAARKTHQEPNAHQDEIISQNVAVLSRRLPVARLISRGVRAQRHARLRQLGSDSMYQQANAAYYPGETWVKDQIDESCERRGEYAALVTVKTLS